MRFVLDRGDAELVGDDRGDGPTVVLLHAGAERRRVWEPIVARLVSDGYRCVTLDLRAHGESTGDVRSGFDAYVGDGEALMAHVATPAVWVGSSLGGLVALEVAARLAAGPASEQVKGLVLVDVLPDFPASELVRAGIEAMVGPEIAGSALVSEIVVRAPEMLVRAHALRQPILVVRGGSSFAVPEATATRFVERAVSASQVVVPDCGHLVARDRPAELAEVLRDFLSPPELRNG